MDPIGRGGVVPGSQFVDPRVLARIGNLDLLARTVVDGFINGLHRSPYFGASVDFAEHRGYVPGDDIRRVDWRLFARTDRFYVKEFEADSNANFAILLDVSASMRFSSGGVSKLDYAKYVAACLTYLARRQRDRVGIATFDDAVVESVPCSAKHFDLVLHALDRAVPRRAGRIEHPIDQVAEQFRRRGLLVLLSDLYEEPDVLMRALGKLAFRGHDLIVFHVLDSAELEFPYSEASSFEDLETGEHIPLVPEMLAEQYRGLIRDHISEISSRCAGMRIDYALFDTSMPLDHALARFLAARERLTQVR